MRTNITFKLKYEELNGFIKLCFNNMVCPIIMNDLATVTLDIDLPGIITISVLGKHNDTIVDGSGNILKDKHVEITNVSIDHFELNETFLFHKMQTKCNNEVINTGNYLGSNGIITIDLKEDTVFKQVVSCNNKLKGTKI